MTPRDLIRGASESFRRAGIPDPEYDSALLLSFLCGRPPLALRLDAETDQDPETADRFRALCHRRLRREPLQYILGETWFCGFRFQVDPRVLIPRPETELMCRTAIKIASRIQRMRVPYGKKAKPVRILDLCTGSGNIAWTLALSVPGVEVLGVDNSEAALSVASSQDFTELLHERKAVAPKFICRDVLDLSVVSPSEMGSFDLILSNPPYIMESEKKLMRRNVLDYEPASALFVSDEDPLVYYRAIIHWAQRLMAPQGKGIVECNEVLGQETESLFVESGYPLTEIIKDFYEKKRFVLFEK